MKKYKNFLNENNEFKFNEPLLKYKIENLKNWIYDNNGLGMMNIINSIFISNGYCVDQSDLSKEKEKFYKDLEYLKLTNFPNYYINRRLKDLNNMKIVKTNQNGEYKWHFVNKLNTNYSDLANLLVYIIKKMVNDENENIKKFGKNVYNNIINDPKLGLLEIKDRIEKIITYYLIKNSESKLVNGKKGLGDFMKFTSNIINFSYKGQHAEDAVERHLILEGFDILVKGGDGDFIDMLYGVDMVVFREDIGYKSVQIKTYKPNTEYLNRYKTDWLIIYRNNFTQIIDIKTKQIINL